MELHYFTLKRQVADINRSVAGASISASWSQVKNEQMIEVSGGTGIRQFLHISVDARFPFILRVDEWKRAKNSANILPELVGLRIQKIDVLQNERIIEITFFDTPMRYLIHLFRNHANAFLLNGDNEIINSFKGAKKHISQTYKILPARIQPVDAHNFESFAGLIPRGEPMPAGYFLQKKFLLVSKILAGEICFRTGISAKTDICDLDEPRLRHLFDTALALRMEAAEGAPRIYLEEYLPLYFSLIELRHLSPLASREFSTLNEALSFFIFKKQRGETLAQKREKNLALVEKKIGQTDHVLLQLKNLPDEKSQRENYRKMGDLILAQLHAIPAGAEEVTLVDYFDPDLAEIKIKLNRQLPAAENARQYFSRAKQAGEKLKEIHQRIKYLENTRQKIQALREKLENTTDFKSLVKIEKQLLELHVMQGDVEKMEGVFKPYKSIMYQNWEIWIGKNARSNDEMTFRHAHKEDYWLHAQGVAGSHVVIRNPRKLESIPGNVVEYAARLAAGQSGAKHSGYVPVMITRVKYVRKPRGSAPGAVTPERIKSIFVEPKI